MIITDRCGQYISLIRAACINLLHNSRLSESTSYHLIVEMVQKKALALTGCNLAILQLENNFILSLPPMVRIVVNILNYVRPQFSHRYCSNYIFFLGDASFILDLYS